MEKINILIVEDRSDFQKIYMNIMNRLQCKYIIASSLVESQELLKNNIFHVALIDLSLSDLETNNRDGFKVLDLIREANLGTQSIILTAYGKSRDADNIIKGKYDVVGFVDKAEMNITDLTSRIRNAAEKAIIEMSRPSRMLGRKKDE